MPRLTVVIAPDSFKGTITALDAAAAMGEGWLRVRPGDRLVSLPQADGGEGTLDALAAAEPRARWRDCGAVPGPDGRPVRGRWLQLPNRTAAAELATVSGLPLMRTPDALHAGTHGLGAVLHSASAGPVDRILVGLGGSASTDGGAGLLVALGARLLDRAGRNLESGGAALRNLARLDLSGLVRPRGLLVLSDVTAPLLGDSGAAAVFGPQKGADEEAIEMLNAGLARWADVIGVDPQEPGFGAAGGTAYALVAVLGARLTPGAPHIARATGLVDALADADVLLTGEGRFDLTSVQGKTVGHLLGLPGPQRRIVIAGSIEDAGDFEAWSLTDLAGTADAAISDPAFWLTDAASRAAGS